MLKIRNISTYVGTYYIISLMCTVYSNIHSIRRTCSKRLRVTYTNIQCIINVNAAHQKMLPKFNGMAKRKVTHRNKNCINISRLCLNHWFLMVIFTAYTRTHLHLNRRIMHWGAHTHLV